MTSENNNFPATSKWLLCMCTLLWTLDGCTAVHTIGHDVAEELATFANDGLGVQAFQDYLDTQVMFTDEPLNPQVLVKEIAQAMSSKLQIRIDALTEMKREIEAVYQSNDQTSSNSFTDCCTVALQERDPLLNTQVNFQEICTVGQGVSTATEFLPNSITQVVQTQYEKALGIKYAFYGTEEGVMFNYPSLRVCQDSYDPRFRPWYVETSSPEAKDVVVIIDKSGSMNAPHGTSTLMDTAIAAATTVLDTLNPNDRVGVVSFSDEAETPSGLSSTSTCYRTEMAKATAENKDYLRTYISNLRGGGQTYYKKALDAAFNYFDAAKEVDDLSTVDVQRDKVILFLTDGQHTESNSQDIYNRIALRNADLGNEVVILTYGLGITDNTTATVLENIAKQINNDFAYGEPTEGTYEPVNNPDNLRSTMGSYYDQFLSESQNLIFSVPYLDAFGTGLLISMCLPVKYSGELKGVTCMDLAVNDLLSDITYFREGETSYAFIIDEYGRVLTHPLLPNPSEITNNPLFIYISALESVTGIDAIRASMTRGENGTRVETARIVTSRGNVQLEGVLWENKQSTYSWNPIGDTGFSICLVIGNNDERTSISWIGNYPALIYHRLEFVSGLSTCRQFDRVAAKDKSSVMFAARAFEDPFIYLYREESDNDINAIELYIQGNTDFNPGFKEGVREAVAATAKFEELMSDPQNEYHMHSVWRYVSTDNGVHRIYPGVEIPKNYDPTQRTWYLRAKAYKGRITVSTPYEDAFGAGIVVTLSQAIYEGNPSRQHSTDDRAIAVMGVDFPLQYFYNLATQSAQECDDQTCLVIDNAGFIVAHKDWIVQSQTQPNTADVHVAASEPFLADRLKAANLMKYDGCLNVEELRDQYFWRISIPSGQNGVYESSEFALHEIEDTNIFLVILKMSYSATCVSCQSTYAPCQGNLDSVDCFCPCYSKADIYEYCLGEFTITGDDHPPCTPPVPEVSFTDVNAQDASRVGGLSECYDYTCENAVTDEECSSMITCSWCKYDSMGDALSEAYCTTTDVCPGGYLAGDDTTTVTSGGDAGGASMWWIAIIIIVLIAVIAVIGFFVYKKMSSGKKESSSQPPPSTTAMQGFDNLAMAHTETVNPAAPKHDPLPAPPKAGAPMAGYGGAAQNHSYGGGYLNPVAYSSNDTGGGYEKPQPPHTQYETLDYNKMGLQPATAPYEPPPAYAPIH